ncbi:putative Monoheme cytochrome c [Candidatus Nitrospira nitrosa]|uniref:Putative Monoheme cytochrome c n=1 Tax=Candidatus Nitrospira nitrosa TaxID=1742972 RepID=A0A0S4LC91_9BACT|nr:cytochrome c [Candidatus Nitrospira nitrosa]CUS32754.1 putative Monoheme cytochrome c [Candidatus Nitrospira nitrosa]
MKTILTLAMALISVSTSVVFAQVIRGDAKTGQAVYEQQCLRCHGAKLDGNGPDSKDLVILPANLQAHKSRSKTDWELLVAISNGVLFSPMHGFRGKLTDQQMLDVLSYIRSVARPDITS